MESAEYKPGDKVTGCDTTQEGNKAESVDNAGSTSSDISQSDTKPEQPNPMWHQDPKFNRYWQHYKMVWSWYQQHLKVLNERKRAEYEDYTRKMRTWMQMMQWYGGSRNPQFEWMEAYQQYCRQYTMWQQYYQGYHQQAAGSPGPSIHVKKRMKERSRQGKTTHTRHLKRKVTTPVFHDDHSSYSDPGVYGNDSDGGESEEFEMEITPEMLKFFAQSAKHRKERDAEREGDKAAGGEYVDLAEASAYKKKTTVQPPNERPGVKRTAEMKGLYGPGAAMIHGMETALQLNFDRNCDIKTPRLWPQLPLNIVFH